MRAAFVYEQRLRPSTENAEAVDESRREIKHAVIASAYGRGGAFGLDRRLGTRLRRTSILFEALPRHPNASTYVATCLPKTRSCQVLRTTLRGFRRVLQLGLLLGQQPKNCLPGTIVGDFGQPFAQVFHIQKGDGLVHDTRSRITPPSAWEIRLS